MRRGAKRTARTVGAWAAILCLTATFAAVAQAEEPFTIASFDGIVTEADGTASTQAGAHPYSATASFVFSEQPNGLPTQNPKDITVELPPGFLGNPLATPRCSEEDFIAEACPRSTQVGMTTVLIAGGGYTLPVYNLVPPDHLPAMFGFIVINVPIHATARIRTESDYGVSVLLRDINEGLPVTGGSMTLWGVPADPSHEAERGGPSEARPEAFLTNPTRCSGPLTTGLTARSWQHPELLQRASFVSHDAETPPNPVGVDGCERVPFSPRLTVEPTTTAADSPTGAEVELHLPQSKDPQGLATAALKRAEVTFPAGMTVNPAAVDGLGACTAAQIGLRDPAPASCPDAAKIGAVEIETPLLEEPMQGALYLAKQRENAFGTVLATYLVAEGRGVVIKLAGRIDTGQDGRVTASFDENPQLPFEDLRLQLYGGPRAVLTTPPACGEYEVSARLTPWSGDQAVPAPSSFRVTTGPGGGPCPSGRFSPDFSAGTTNPVAGAHSPFVLRLSREDGTQRFSSLEATLPRGLVAKLAGVPYCPEGVLAGIPSADGTGAAELGKPSCPAASRVGSVEVGVGAGPNPFYVNTGSAYLAGPYKGAPLSLAFVTPAVAGPFDLGNVVVRAALRVDPVTAQVTAASDPLPTILHGIPLDLRDVRVSIDRGAFTLNPTSCDPMGIDGQATAVSGATARLAERFQVAGCERLGFKPKLALRLKGKTRRGGHPALTATLKARKGDANIGKAVVTLPRTQFLEQGHIRTICTRVQYAANSCPKASVYGYAKAWTPLLDQPLEGPVYLRSSNNKLPDLVADLNGQIEIDLAGRIDSVNSRMRTTFWAVPDAPVSKFVLRMQGGRKGLLVNNTELCARKPRAKAAFTGQNGKRIVAEPRVRIGCRG